MYYYLLLIHLGFWTIPSGYPAFLHVSIKMCLFYFLELSLKRTPLLKFVSNY